MSINLDLHDVQVIFTALKYGKKNIAESPNYASYEQKQAYLREVEEVEAKVRLLRDELRDA